MKALSKLDPVAYVRYASVYKDFREVGDFNTFLEKNYKKAGTQ
jgi:transcriptional repressor NrdR